MGGSIRQGYTSPFALPSPLAWYTDLDRHTVKPFYCVTWVVAAASKRFECQVESPSRQGRVNSLASEEENERKGLLQDWKVCRPLSFPVPSLLSKNTRKQLPLCNHRVERYPHLLTATRMQDHSCNKFLPLAKENKSDCQKQKKHKYTVSVLPIFQPPLYGHMLCKTACLAAETNTQGNNRAYHKSKEWSEKIKKRGTQLGIMKQDFIY